MEQRILRWTLLLLWPVAFSLWTPSVEARKVDLTKESFGTYVRGHFATSSVGRAAFGNSSGGQTQFSEEATFGYGVGVGLLWRMGWFGVTFGLDVMTPARLEGISGRNSSGVELLTLRSQVLGVVPNVGLEFGFLQRPRSRCFATLNVGYASVTILNDYQITGAGSSLYGVGNYTEEAQGWGLSGYGGVGFELLLADNAALAIEAGYRTLNVTRFNHSRDVVSLIGNFSKGDALQNSDGVHRSLNLSAPVSTATLRIYF